MDEIRLEENFEGKLLKAEDDLKAAFVVRDKALEKAKNATRSEHVL